MTNYPKKLDISMKLFIQLASELVANYMCHFAFWNEQNKLSYSHAIQSNIINFNRS